MTTIKPAFAILLTMLLASASALAQQTQEHEQHHPGADVAAGTSGSAEAAPESSQPSNSPQSAQPPGMMGQGMPMMPGMQGMMRGMMGQGAHSMVHHPSAGVTIIINMHEMPMGHGGSMQGPGMPGPMPGPGQMGPGMMQMPGPGPRGQGAMPMQGAPGAATADNPSVMAFRQATASMHREMNVQFTGDPDGDFARAMVPHHQGAIEMAKIVLQYGQDPEIRKLAEDVIAAQEQEIVMMREWLANNPQK